MLVVWKLDRLGRNLAHLVNTVQDLSARGVGLRVLAGRGTQIDTTTAAGSLRVRLTDLCLERYIRGHALGCPLVEHIKGNDTGRVH